MSGAFRRAIVARARDGHAHCEVEDDFHHFSVSIAHDGAAVTDATGKAIRHPWSLCPMAARALTALRGMALSTDPTAIYAYSDARGHCTHMFEMADYAITQAARGEGARRYDAIVEDVVDGKRTAEVLRDGEPILQWRIENGVIAAPANVKGKRPGDFRSKSLSGLPHDEAEAILILRRAVATAIGRQMDVDKYDTAAEAEVNAVCFVFTPGRAERATRMRASVRSFTRDQPPLKSAAPIASP